MTLDVRDSLLLGTVARLIQSDALRWGHTWGVGFATARIRGDGVTESQYIHLWHPAFRADEMDDSGMIHDHRYGFRSVVLLGAFHDTEIMSLEPTDDTEGTYQIHEVDAPPDCDVRELPQRYRLVSSEHTYRAGSTFRYPAHKFHRAEVSELTVTLCSSRGDLGGGGRLLARTGHAPVHLSDGWGRELFTYERMRQFREDAARELLDRARDWS